MVQSYLSFAQDNNATFIALRASIEPSPIIKPVKIILFLPLENGEVLVLKMAKQYLLVLLKN